MSTATNNAAHTPWRYEELHDGRESIGLRVYNGDDVACNIYGCGVVDFDNARLFTEAGTVAHETGLTPRQLAEQRAELLEALRTARSHIAATGWPKDSSGNYDKDGEWDFDAMTRNGNSADASEIKNAFQVLGDAIANATGGVK